jgi:anti-anti-sigma factor
VSVSRDPHFPADEVDPPQDDGASPSPGPAGTATTRSRSALVIGRYQETVVVTVHGELEHPRTAHLGHVLADLIDGQGNMSLVVDLHDATAADARQMLVLADADQRARQRGGSITLSKPSAALHQVLRQQGLGHVVEPLPPPVGRSSRRQRRAHPNDGSPSHSSGGSRQ